MSGHLSSAQQNNSDIIKSGSGVYVNKTTLHTTSNERGELNGPHQPHSQDTNTSGFSNHNHGSVPSGGGVGQQSQIPTASIVINKPIVIQFQNKKITFKNHHHHHYHHHHHSNNTQSSINENHSGTRP
jgi:hypothetical protein